MYKQWQQFDSFHNYFIRCSSVATTDRFSLMRAPVFGSHHSHTASQPYGQAFVPFNRYFFPSGNARSFSPQDVSSQLSALRALLPHYECVAFKLKFFKSKIETVKMLQNSTFADLACITHYYYLCAHHTGRH